MRFLVRDAAPSVSRAMIGGLRVAGVPGRMERRITVVDANREKEMNC